MSYPVAINANFAPGGVSDSESVRVLVAGSSPERLTRSAASADDQVQPFLPSLSLLAEAIFGALTGCPPDAAKDWANALVATRFDDNSPSLLQYLQTHTPPVTRKRPCGYVFQRGDIAWNCRTCQTDATCVICDACFRNSSHEGHEVYFHRTSPGGCCDCGDAEAWKREGCCEAHRPEQEAAHQPEDPIQLANKAQGDARAALEATLPTRLAASLGIVVGAAVHAILEAVDGAAMGADPVQWKRAWADQAARIVNDAVHNQDYRRNLSAKNTFCTWLDFWSENSPPLPEGFRLFLRLHNDDVHTFDEVIDALHEPRQLRRGNSDSLVDFRDQATEMTHHVDADGQVTVKEYHTFASALQGYRRLKSRGLHCAVVSTAQVHLEQRARLLTSWLSEIAAAHPGVAAMVVHALVQQSPMHTIALNVYTWHEARTIPTWISAEWKTKMFPAHLPSSYLTHEESEYLHGMALEINQDEFSRMADPNYYANVPYRLPSRRYKKSPHALWGTLPAHYVDPAPLVEKHPLLQQLANAERPMLHNQLTEEVFVVDTDLRKQQEAERITAALYPHRLPGLYMISGIGTCREASPPRPPLPSPMDLRHLLATCSFRAPASPLLYLLLLDPYPTKQLRGSVHALFLSLLTDSRFRCRFAGALGVAYRPLSTLFCAGVGTEADTPLHFTVQIFTAGSLVKALGQADTTEQLLVSDGPASAARHESYIGVFAIPIALTIVRCIHTNLLGATKEVNMILNNTYSSNDETSQDEGTANNDGLLPALTYVAGEHPLLTLLPAAPDDGFLDSRSTRHKRLPHLLRDLEYVIETPGTAVRLLLPARYPIYQGPALSLRGEDILTFPLVYARMMRLAQGMDPQKRKISGGHVEYEQNRWLEAFGLSLNFAGTRDALAESPSEGASMLEGESALAIARDALGNLIKALICEMKFWLYREGMMETGLPVPSAGPLAVMDVAQVETLQRSTLHVTGANSVVMEDLGQPSVGPVALSCATGVKMTESQLNLIENALKFEELGRKSQNASYGPSLLVGITLDAPSMADWLRVPHQPLGGDALSFHLPLHRTLAKTIRSLCSLVVTEDLRTSDPHGWWRIPTLDEVAAPVSPDILNLASHPLIPLVRSTLRSSNCRVAWSSGPDCSSQEAQRRRNRSRTVSANIAVAKIVHSLADHPARCLAAAQQIERHLWARNGSSVAGMAMNYSSAPLCRSFRDLDLLMLQLSAAGFSVGLGARRMFAMLLSRFTMEGYLCDPERRPQSSGASSPSSFGGTIWINPPRLQDSEHAVALSESFFATMCVLVTELPPPPPNSTSDDMSLRDSIKRELIHALAAEPRSRSEAMNAAAIAVTRRDENEGSTKEVSGGLFRMAFGEVLNEIAQQKSPRSGRASSGPAAFELRPDFCDEYDPTFYHLRRPEHQHAMDIIARLRKVKFGSKDSSDAVCLPLVCPPPKAHPRFLPCRLLLHLPAIDAAIRRYLLFALTGGSWLPPSEPSPKSESNDGEDKADNLSEMSGISVTNEDVGAGVPVTTFNQRFLQTLSTTSSSFRRPLGEQESNFSQKTVRTSSVSFLEVLQLLTLQAHTLEECASLHRTLPVLDEESRSLSYSLSINSYLRRLIHVPESLRDVWAFRPYPSGPLQSGGSGANRASTLGLLIALYEHRSDHGAGPNAEGEGDEGHGGARVLVASGLKWLLRFINALVDGAPSVSVAIKSATSGVPFRNSSPMKLDSASSWTIDENIRSSICGMLMNLPELWPKAREKSATPDIAAVKNKERGKAAQQRMMELMKQKQQKFAASMGPTESQSSSKIEDTDQEADLCIICRCDDADGENNGPLGYLGHVQRSRCAQLRYINEQETGNVGIQGLTRTFRVVGHMGCQLRESEAMDSKALTCLPKGSVVTVMKIKISPEYGILSRRVLVRHVMKDSQTGEDVITEGWASIQSSQGYVILSPLLSLCYSYTRWGSTRPIIKQCGHAAHLKCVETHTLSLHQRAAGEQPYDGRFAANISDGEFLCPLCKQLSNILIPRDNFTNSCSPITAPLKDPRPMRLLLIGSPRTLSQVEKRSEMRRQALEDFGSHLYNGMSVPWERISSARRKQQQQWHPAIQKWDYEEDPEHDSRSDHSTSVGGTLRLLRQQLIAWAAVGHSASASEAASRGVEVALPFGLMSQTTEPWSDFSNERVDKHPMLLEMKRTLSGASGLIEFVDREMAKQLAKREARDGETTIIGACLADILEGWSWILRNRGTEKEVLWSQLASLMSAMPCHVARDGTLPHRSEARATAAAMWTVQGVGSEDRARHEPPIPLAVRQALAGSNSTINIPRGWGTMNPFQENAGDSKPILPRDPFRPGIASSFLYTPLLAWDLCTYAGAVFSKVLVNDVKDLPTCAELLELARTLIVARLIQAMITPGGFEMPDEMELDEEDCWSQDEIEQQSNALWTLFSHCQKMLLSRSLDDKVPLTDTETDLSASSLLAGLGRAILPFGRAVILILRACLSVIRERQKLSGISFEAGKYSDALEGILYESKIMTFDDGFKLLRSLQGPYPSDLAMNPWLDLINRWLVSVIALELHHGSTGSGTISAGSQMGTSVSANITGKYVPHGTSLVSSRGNRADGRYAEDMEVMYDHDEENEEEVQIAPQNVVLFEDEDVQDDFIDDIDMDEAEEMVGFAERIINVVAGNTDTDDAGESSDENSESASEGDHQDSDREFAHLSRSPIIAYQPSLLGMSEVGPGRQGNDFEFSTASAVMADLSHFGAVQRMFDPTFSLIRLPKSFVELYNIVNKVKGREEASSNDDHDDGSGSESAICLLTGAVMRSGSVRRSAYNRAQRPPGACTLHARKTGSGIGIFFLVQKCTVLLMHNNKSAYSPSIYVDEHGEEDPGLRRGRPLFLNEARYRALEMLWRQQGVPREVAQIRSTSDRVIRDNWY